LHDEARQGFSDHASNLKFSRWGNTAWAWGRETYNRDRADRLSRGISHPLLHQEEAKSNQESQDMKQIPSTYQVFLTVGACPTLSGLLAQQAAIGARLEAVEATPVPWPSLLAAWQISTDNEAR
jgi:hypothetical protein